MWSEMELWLLSHFLFSKRVIKVVTALYPYLYPHSLKAILSLHSQFSPVVPNQERPQKLKYGPRKIDNHWFS